ncbi:MAG: LysM peptidoglycan-binding domain-containing protein [Chloroflexota bacterium]
MATPTPTSSLLALLDPCPDRVDCYLYTVRRNDTLHKIADTFGVSYSTVRALNPQIVDPNLIRVGDRIVLPPPTR